MSGDTLHAEIMLDVYFVLIPATNYATRAPHLWNMQFVCAFILIV